MEQSNSLLYDAGKRSITATYVLWFFFGWVGAHRFYAGYKLSGALMLALACFGWYRVIAVEGAGFLALIFLGIWVLIDAALIPSMVRTSNLKTAAGIRSRAR
ncbi:TM2 domain-containing protein [Pusillimonas sp. ANT_WB101]|uniref:TM2 domain-containing protein n=1 Tax=Pusillimonas sp. ANT_WB101 TaxID=2597356 RepID=UPI0011EB9FEB|nr:TM2 domain-containing protein [Pusillimonas sp. ANT_WB101]